MYKIQIISNERKQFNMIDNSTYDDLKALDSYDINIIDLSSPEIWINNSSGFSAINKDKDLELLRIMINNSKRTRLIYILPQNVNFYYYGMSSSKEMKYVISIVAKDILNEKLGIPCFTFQFEPNITNIGDFEIKSSFYIYGPSGNVLTRAKDTEKVTSVETDRRIYTTLCLETEEEILSFLTEINLLENERKNIPQWMNSIKMFNDYELLERKEENSKKIRELEVLNEKLVQQLKVNNYYKSILYSSGDYLVEVVFKILEEMLQINLSEFKDKKKEDLLFKKDGVTFIGEIKGISSNVKSENVWQLEQHIQEYNQLLQDNGQQETTKGLLIINHQRNKPLNDRETINDYQIILSKRYGSLIVETNTLLKMYELFKSNQIDSEKIIDVLKNKEGILKLEVFSGN